MTDDFSRPVAKSLNPADQSAFPTAGSLATGHNECQGKQTDPAFGEARDAAFEEYQQGMKAARSIMDFCEGANWARSHTLQNEPVKGLVEALTNTLNYLHWNADNLSGDDLIGDGRLTKKYNKQIAEIEEALKAFEQGVGDANL